MSSMEVEGEGTQSFYEASGRKFTKTNEKVQHTELDSGMGTEDGRRIG